MEIWKNYVSEVGLEHMTRTQSELVNPSFQIYV